MSYDVLSTSLKIRVTHTIYCSGEILVIVGTMMAPDFYENGQEGVSYKYNRNESDLWNFYLRCEAYLYRFQLFINNYMSIRSTVQLFIPTDINIFQHRKKS